MSHFSRCLTCPAAPGGDGLEFAGDIQLQFFIHKGQRGPGEAAGAATGRLQPQLAGYCWSHTACGMDGDVTEVGLEDIDVSGERPTPDLHVSSTSA